MKTSEQIVKGERVDMTATVSEARNEVAKKEFDAAAAEAEERSLEVELLKAEAAAQKQEEAERVGKETKEKISEAVA